MKKTFFVLITFSMIVACAPMGVRDTSHQEISDTPRTIEIGGKTYDKYTLWGCREYSSSFGTVLELVRIDIPPKSLTKDDKTQIIQENKTLRENKNKKKVLEAIDKIEALLSQMQVGYILFDGRKEYNSTFYSRKGINHRWDWDDSYSFIIKPDGTGLYYDFSSVKKGESTKARDVFKCRKIYE